MSDEFDVTHLGHDDVQSIIDWAVKAAGMVFLMHESPPHKDRREGMLRLEGFLEAVQVMLDNMPDALVAPAVVVAKEAVDIVVENEQKIEEFRQELDDL